MRKLFSYLTIAAVALGFAACNNEDVPEPQIGGNTYVGVRLAFPGIQDTRALPDDYNKNGVWQGRDAIETITVYVVNVTKGTVDYTTFGIGHFEGIDANGFLKPTLAVKATAGENIKAYAVVNDFNDKTGTTLKATGADNFDTKFKELEVAATVAEVAKFTVDANTNAVTETVMMTNDAGAAIIASVEANVSEQDAKNGVKNRADITVSRVASRGIVTIGTNVQATPINVTDANDNVVSTLTLKSVTYAVGQSNKKFFNMHKANWSTPEPVYSFVPSPTNLWEGGTGGNTNFDYSDLASPKSLQTITNITPSSLVVAALQAEKFSKFVLPVTHLDNNYRKGNTTYFEITCKFVPSAIDGVATTGTTLPQTVYLGMNDGKFYSTRALATANGQTATEYLNGVMKYILWLNPNKPYGGTEKITMSPTVRNQVYHAHISAFKAIGVPNNPLDPNDPDNPDNPDNPIDPDDPLQTEDTYMSVSITVLPWTIHSYSVELNDNLY